MKRFIRVVIRLFIIILGLYVIALIILYFFQEKLLFHPQVLPQNHEFSFSGDYEELYIPVENDVNLHGILFKAKNSKGLVFYLHGNGGCVEGWGNSATAFTSSGYDLFMLDYRGYGKSGGSISSEDQLNNDIAKAYHYILTNYSPAKTVIAGYSIGTGPATYLAANNNPDLLLLQAPYYSLNTLVDEKVPLLPEFVKRYKYPTYSYMEKLSCPVYFFHGTDDALIPFEHSVKLQEKRGNKPGALMPLEGHGHNAINTSEVFSEKLKKVLE